MRSRAGIIVTIALCFASLRTASAAAPDTLSVPVPPAIAERIGLLRTDRLQHSSFSFTCALGVGLATRRPALGASSTIALGIAKELWDRRRTGFDRLDLTADLLGATLALALAAALDR